MKNLLLLLVITMTSISMVQAQDGATNWRTTDCFKGIEYKVEYFYISSTGNYEAYVNFNNRYTNDITFNYAITGGNYSSKNNRVTVKSGETHRSYTGASFTSTHFNVTVDRATRKGMNGYAECDNKAY